jgi:hypothetical protein
MRFAATYAQYQAGHQQYSKVKLRGRSENTVSQSTGDKLGARSYLQRDLKLLFGSSAVRCSFPDCHELCIEPSTPFDRAAITAYIAHIEAHSDSGPRANPMLTRKQRDAYDNLILLCPRHHIVVDEQPNTYSSDDLRRWKAEHERWVEDRLREAMPRVTLAELKVVAIAILQSPDDPDDSFVLTPPTAKMDKNGLKSRSRNLLKIGLAKARDVERMIQHMAVIDPDFPGRLKAGFVAEYNDLFDSGLYGDSLFEGLKIFAIGQSTDFDMQCAGLAVLSYMFETCEIFEP